MAGSVVVDTEGSDVVGSPGVEVVPGDEPPPDGELVSGPVAALLPCEEAPASSLVLGEVPSSGLLPHPEPAANDSPTQTNTNPRIPMPPRASTPHGSD